MKTFLFFLLMLTAGRPVPAQPATHAKPTNVAILLYPGAELLDFAGPLEVFSLMSGARVYTVATKPGPLTTMQEMLTVTPNYTPATAPIPDVLVIPGARPESVRAVADDSTVLNWVRRNAAGRQLTMSVCTGAYVLGRAGLLDNRTVTTHWASTEMLQQMHPKAKVMERVRFVEDGRLLTTAGVSAGIDGALRVVERLRGREAARTVARIMEYDHWNPQSGLIVGRVAGRTAKAAAQPPATRRKPAATVPVRVSRTPRQLNVPLASPTDPVCKMDVSAGRADTTRYMGKVYGFCSKICKERFTRRPGTFLN